MKLIKTFKGQNFLTPSPLVKEYFPTRKKVLPHEKKSTSPRGCGEVLFFAWGSTITPLFKWMEIEERNDSEWLPEDLSDLWDIREFSSSIASYFNYSYKRFDDYVCFSKKFIEEKKRLKIFLFIIILEKKKASEKFPVTVK